MASTLSTAIRILMQPRLAESNGWTFSPGLDIQSTLSTGTAANQADLVYAQTPSITAASPLDLDLAGGSLKMPNLAAASFVEIVAMLVRNNATTAGRNTLIGGGSNPFLTWLGAGGDIIKVGPGGIFFLENPSDGYAVTAGTGDILRFDMSSGTESVDIVLIGRSA